MSKLIKAKINLSKCNKKLFFKGEKGIYLDVDIWLNDKPDKYGNDVSIEQSTKEKDAEKIYIGEGKVKWSSEKTALDLSAETAEFNDDLGF